MNDERYWILDPEGHRRVEAAGGPPSIPGWEGAEVIVIAPDPEDWCCDRCNATIPTKIEDGSPAMVPATSGGSALCIVCAVSDGYVVGRPGSWSPSGVTCGCAACHEIAIHATTEIVGRRLPEHATTEPETMTTNEMLAGLGSAFRVDDERT